MSAKWIFCRRGPCIEKIYNGKIGKDLNNKEGEKKAIATGKPSKYYLDSLVEEGL